MFLFFWYHKNFNRLDLFPVLKFIKYGHRLHHLQVFFKIGYLKSFVKFTGKHLCRGLFFNKVTSLQFSSLLKGRLQYRCFPIIFLKFSRATFSQITPGWLFLYGHVQIIFNGLWVQYCRDNSKKKHSHCLLLRTRFERSVYCLLLLYGLNYVWKTESFWKHKTAFPWK